MKKLHLFLALSFIGALNAKSESSVFKDARETVVEGFCSVLGCDFRRMASLIIDGEWILKEELDKRDEDVERARLEEYMRERNSGFKEDEHKYVEDKPNGIPHLKEKESGDGNNSSKKDVSLWGRIVG